MRLAADHADVWETSFATVAEFGRRRSAVEQMAAGRHLTTSLEIDGFVSTSAVGLDRLLERVRTERGSTEDLDAIFERALIGAPNDIARQLDTLAAAGVDQVVVALHDPHDPDALEAIAEAGRRHNGYPV